MPDYVAPSATTPYKSVGGVHFRQFVNDSIGSSSVVAAPAAGASVVFLVIPITGTYSVQLLYGVTDVAGTAGNGNLKLQVQNVTITSLTMLAALNTLQAATLILTVLQGQAIVLSAVAADAGKIAGTIIATQIG